MKNLILKRVVIIGVLSTLCVIFVIGTWVYIFKPLKLMQFEQTLKNVYEPLINNQEKMVDTSTYSAQQVTPTEEFENEDELDLLRCTNDVYEYSLKYPDDLYTDYRWEVERCNFFSFSPIYFSETEKAPLVPIQISFINSSYSQLIEELGSSLEKYSTDSFQLKNGENAIRMKGNWPAESEKNGNSFYMILIPRSSGQTLVFELSGNATEQEREKFEILARFVSFL